MPVLTSRLGHGDLGSVVSSPASYEAEPRPKKSFWCIMILIKKNISIVIKNLIFFSCAGGRGRARPVSPPPPLASG